MADRINTGLSKLLEASRDVAKMKIELTQKEKDLCSCAKEVLEFLVEITAQTTAAQKVKDEVQIVKDNCSATASRIEADKNEAERDLEPPSRSCARRGCAQSH